MSANIVVPWDEKVRLKRFDSWDLAREAGYRSRTQWRRLGRGVRGRSLATINWMGRDVMLYHEEETTRSTPKTIAIDRLLDRFVVRDEILGFQPLDSDDWPQRRIERGLRNLVRQGWNHARCHKEGVRLKLSRNSEVRVRGFAIRAPDKTNFFAIDLDCHSPTQAACSVHLELLEAVLERLPHLVASLGGGATFAQYRQIDTSGIQLWAALRWKQQINDLHQQVRSFLLDFAEANPTLDDRLAMSNLPTLREIEILPTTGHVISMPGICGKSVFTDQELKLVKGWFDVVGLASHIEQRGQLGEVLPRYSALLEQSAITSEWLMLRSAPQVRPFGAGLTIPELPSATVEVLSFDSDVGKRYWTDLKRTARDGITSPDKLYEDFLQPVAQCLYFRDFVNKPDRARLVEEELVAWVLAKSNGNVSRVRVRKTSQIRGQIRRVVNNLEKTTCSAVRQYYLSILANDLLFPHRVEHLWQYMRRGAAEAELNTIYEINCKCIVSPTTCFRDDSPLPQALQERVRVAAGELRRGKVRDRFTTWATRFINACFHNGTGSRSIGWRAINEMMDKPTIKNRVTQDKYKALLVRAGIIKRGWERYIRRNAASSKYEMTDWAFQEMASSRVAISQVG